MQISDLAINAIDWCHDAMPPHNTINGIVSHHAMMPQNAIEFACILLSEPESPDETREKEPNEMGLGYLNR